MNVSELYGKYKGETVYIVGTGPTLKCFPIEFLKDKLTIGLNQAWKSLSFQCTYNLSIHPDECIPKHYREANQTWITKRKGWLKEKKPDIYWFSNNENVKDYKYLTSTDNTLYVGRGIHTAALCLASKMGVSYAVLVGVDMNSVRGSHHVTDQSVRFHGLPPKEVYKEYYLNAVEVRNRLSIKILNLTSLIGLGYTEDETSLLLPLCQEKPKDDSAYRRSSLDFR